MYNVPSITNVSSIINSLSSLKPPKNNKYYTFEEVFIICNRNFINYTNVELLKSVNLLCENNISEYEEFLAFSQGVSFNTILKSCVKSYKNMPDLRNV